MATVNVYTYYHHKLAWEKARRHAVLAPSAPRRSPALSIPRLVQLGAAFGLLLSLGLAFAWEPAHAPLLASLGTLWGVCIGCLAEWVRYRSTRFMKALRGGRLDADDLAALTGRPAFVTSR